MGRIRILHTGDLHINSLKKFEGYLDRAERTLFAIHEVAKSRKCDLIVVAGDVWTTKSITHQERQVFSNWLSQSPVPVVAISGNHDKRGRSIGDTSLGYLSSLSSRSALKNHFIWDQGPLVTDFKKCRFILFPFEGWSHVEFDLMLQATTRYAEKTNAKGLPIVVVMHEEVRGAIYDNGEKATESQKQIVLVKDRYPMVDYWALGHIHKSQKIMPNAYYCGSPHQTKFGENDGKGVLVVELERGALPSTTLVPIKSKPLVQLEELPDPPPKNAYVQYKPRSIEARVKNLPPNIVYHPDIQMFKRSERKSAQLSTGLLDNLDVWLRDSGQRKKMRRRSWKLVKEMCGKLDPPIKVRIPKQYRRKDKR